MREVTLARPSVFQLASGAVSRRLNAFVNALRAREGKRESKKSRADISGEKNCCRINGEGCFFLACFRSRRLIIFFSKATKEFYEKLKMSV